MSTEFGCSCPRKTKNDEISRVQRLRGLSRTLDRYSALWILGCLTQNQGRTYSASKREATKRAKLYCCLSTRADNDIKIFFGVYHVRFCLPVSIFGLTSRKSWATVYFRHVIRIHGLSTLKLARLTTKIYRVGGQSLFIWCRKRSLSCLSICLKVGDGCWDRAIYTLIGLSLNREEVHTQTLEFHTSMKISSCHQTQTHKALSKARKN